MLLPAPDTSSLPMDGSYIPDVLNTSDIADPSGSTAAGDSGWSTTLQGILAATVTAADKTYLPGTPAAGVPVAHPPYSAGVHPSVSGVSSTWSMSTLLLVGGLVLLLVVLVVAMKRHS